jgi:GalNAc-alpha-(1->4)-GalNAc-alpha-(1->3)-diNAcBac-PP-undecaprenol alpha-1,4-N-acetyl-D-galactosaminyltransferase
VGSGKRRIALVIPSLAGGGAERSLVALAAGFQDAGQEVTVVTEQGPERDVYDLPGGVRRLSLGIAPGPRPLHRRVPTAVHRLRALRHASLATDPDVVISFMAGTNVAVLIALLGTRYPVVVTEHTDPAWVALGPVWSRLAPMAYARAAKVVSVSQGVDRCFGWLPARQRAVVPNPVTIPRAGRTPSPPGVGDPTKAWVVAMGRLAPEKGFDVLLRAFAMLAERYTGWQLLILGEGPLRPRLERLRDELGLGARVALPGFIRDPVPVLRRAELFVLSSRTEGFGNALAEAMACGVASIATDCPGGPREIIRHNVDGILVRSEDPGALAETMDWLMGDEPSRRRLASKALEIRDRFGLPGVLRLWNEILAQVAR